MTMQQKQKQKPITHRCQKKHIHPHNKTVENFYCSKCKAPVQITSSHKCMCCGFKVSFKDNKSTVQEQRILNQFVSNYKIFIDWYQNNGCFLEKSPMILQLKIGYWIYQIDARWLLKYIEIANLDSYNEYNRADLKPPKNALKNYNKMLATIQLIKPHLHKVDFEISWGRSKVTLAD